MKKYDFIPCDPKLAELARQLRNSSTLPEKMLWNRLKGKQMQGYDFHRQKPIDNYIVDFFCKELMLAIELDGESHDFEERLQNDLRRQSRLESMGIRFLRFTNDEVTQNAEGVVYSIGKWIEEHTPGPSQEGS